MLTKESKHLLSLRDQTKEEILALLDQAKHSHEKAGEGKIVASCFFEPSTRTRLSFEAAAHRIGAKVIGIAEAGSSSLVKGETLHDTVRMLSSYADLIVLRHPEAGAARFAAEVSDVPVINAGDGGNEHPTQALVDLYTMREEFGFLEGLRVAMVGDLRNGRTVHSLVDALMKFKARLFFIAPPGLELPPGLKQKLKESGTLFSFHPELSEVLPQLDVLYVTRLQKERMMGAVEVDYRVKLEDLRDARPELRILHPLPRVDELDEAIDETLHALYFKQAKNGVTVRKALLAELLGGVDGYNHN